MIGKTTISIPSTVFLTQTITPTQPIDDVACRLCHSETSSQIQFPSGETLSVQVDTTVLDISAHGLQSENPLACTSCHAPTRYQFPHTALELTDLRTYQLEQAETCTQCHQPHLTSHPDLQAENGVGCTDCHGSHEVHLVEQWTEGEATGVCVNCHEQEDVPFADATRLTSVIQNGLFTDQVDNEYCLACHSQSDFSLTFENGDTLSLTIDKDAFHNSVHGAENVWDMLQCTDCHKNYRFPHEAVTATNAREYSLDRYSICASCHEQNAELAQDSVHAIALAEGEMEAAVCTDCHGAHDTPVPNEPRERISHTCQQCHSAIFDEYAGSVHGEALLSESNPDVPTCIECHGVHNIGDPTTNLFRIRSPQLCAECHADQALMEEYEISTEVFDTYVADFHGTTVTLFEHQDPTVETNKAVCYDCHGVHNIKKSDDPEAGIKANLLATCRQCHPDASNNFPDAWTSHFRPSLQNNTFVYLVNLFYQIVTPLTVSFLSFLVLTDMYRKVRLRIRRNK